MNHEQIQGPVDELKYHWKTEIFDKVLHAWIQKNKQNLTQAECKKVNDLFSEGYNIWIAIDADSKLIDMIRFLQNMNKICFLINRE